MKKLILSVAMALAISPVYAQVGQMGGSAQTPDMSANPSGVGFGGAMGGANNTAAPTNVPSNTLPRSTDFGSGTIQQDQQRIQEQQAPASGGLSTPSPTQYNSTTIPSGPAPAVPTTPATTSPGMGSGLGTGTGTGVGTGTSTTR